MFYTLVVFVIFIIGHFQHLDIQTIGFGVTIGLLLVVIQKIDKLKNG